MVYPGYCDRHPYHTGRYRGPGMVYHIPPEPVTAQLCKAVCIQILLDSPVVVNPFHFYMCVLLKKKLISKKLKLQCNSVQTS